MVSEMFNTRLENAFFNDTPNTCSTEHAGAIDHYMF